jgi:hypothetical protein
MTKFLKIAGVVLLCALLLFAVKQIFFKTPSFDKKVVALIKGHSYDKSVTDFVKTINKSCPDMIDPETRMDKVLLYGENNLQFNYTLVHMIKDSLPIPTLKKYMEPVIYGKIRNSGTLRQFLNKNLTWIYSYSDKNGDFIFKVTYTPDMFKD